MIRRFAIAFVALLFASVQARADGCGFGFNVGVGLSFQFSGCGSCCSPGCGPCGGGVPWYLYWPSPQFQTPAPITYPFWPAPMNPVMPGGPGVQPACYSSVPSYWYGH
jgi:hypothetical protein